MLDRLALKPEELLRLAIEQGLNLAFALAVFLLGWWIAGAISRSVKRHLARQDGMDPTAAGFIATTIKYVIRVAVLIGALEMIGIKTTSLVAVLGAGTLAIGLALQSTLANFAAGVMLLIFRPFKVGDYVSVAGHEGNVTAITLFTTELATVENVQVTIPNKQTWGAPVVNYSAHERRRVDLVVGVDYGANLDTACRVIREAIAADPRASGQPEPFVKVTKLGESAVDITLRVWCGQQDYWDLKFDLTKTVKERLDQAGISIPYPHLEIVKKPAPVGA